ncbi:MAG TPA: peptidoglycan-binding domain-containing protein, partial [Chthoniobacterales bacterium]|nr:peptidoglycan-binding domain-containing protein [Chthoniobacterales bacterium]
KRSCHSLAAAYFAFMRKILTGFAVLLTAMTVQPIVAAPRMTSIEGIYPATHAYDSAGYSEIVRKVQLALEEEGYWVGSHSGNFGFETRAAVRRYRRDHGLAIVGKIDQELLNSLGFR